jgi:LmbE family N-acetylglucosaminyl deacetylase
MNHPRIPDATSLTAFAGLLRSANPGHPAGDELIIVVAHPDDETIGIGGHLAALSHTTIIHVTDGAPRDLRDAKMAGFARSEDYAEARREELAAAMGIAGIGVDQLFCLGISDQEAARNLVPLTFQLAGFFRDRTPRFVATHPFEGGHPDHDATAFAVAAACRLLGRGGFARPIVVEMAYYHLGSDGPVYQDFAAGSSAACLEIELDRAALEKKQRMLACFVSQRRTLAPFTSSVERFRIAADCDFRLLPNGGRLLYERLLLGLTGEQWFNLARAAADELELEGT